MKLPGNTSVLKRQRARSIITATLIEAWPYLILTALVFIVMRHVANSNWQEIFLYNGDSITLPLVEQSLARGEPFNWVFSTQTFLFPEFPIYWMCSVVARSVRGALVLNAFVNVLVLYTLFRQFVRFVAPRHRLRQVVFATTAVALYLACTISERDLYIIPPGIVHPVFIATLFMVSTYYYGVILISLTAIVLILWFTRRFRFGDLTRRRVVIFGLSTIVLCTLTSYSNPLLLLQFMLPAGVGLLFLVAVRRMPIRWFVTIVGSLVVSAVLGEALRLAFARFLPGGIERYVDIDRADDSARQLIFVVQSWSQSPAGLLKLTIVVVPIVASLCYLIYLIVYRAKGRPDSWHEPSTLDMFVTSFIFVSSVSLIAGQVVTGQVYTRYLIPLFIFPLMFLLLVADESSLGAPFRRVLNARRRWMPKATAAVAVAGIALSLVGIGLSVRPVARMASATVYEPAQCLDDWLDGRALNGTAQFMLGRPIMLYGDQRGALVQVQNFVDVQAWMNNIALYADRDFSYVLVDDENQRSTIVKRLGTPASVTSCPTFQIYDYAGTRGNDKLNGYITRWLNTYGGKYLK